MSISLITYDGGQLSARDHALESQAATGAGGIIYGCAAAASGNQAIRIADGVGVLLGRLFHVTAQTLDVALPSANYVGQVYVTIDLSNTEAPISLNVRTGATLDDLVSDDDFNWSNGIGYLPITNFTVNSSGVANVEDINRFSAGSSGGGSTPTPTGDFTVVEQTWKGLNVSFSIYKNAYVFVVVHGTTNVAITTKNAWVTVKDMSQYFHNPRNVEGYAVINSLQRCRYRIGTDNVFKIGYGINVAGGGAENIAKGYYVSFNFVFPLQ